MRGTQNIGGSAVATSYDNSTSGLTATNVQAAIDEVVLMDTVNCTVQSGFTLPSWGTVKVIRIGKVGLLSIWGLRADAAITSSTLALALPWASATGVAGVGYVDGQTTNCMIRIGTNSTDVFINNVNAANTSIYAQVVYPIA